MYSNDIQMAIHIIYLYENVALVGLSINIIICIPHGLVANCYKKAFVVTNMYKSLQLIGNVQ